MNPTPAQIRNKLKKKALQVQVMTARRRKLWAMMVKKEICKVMFLNFSSNWVSVSFYFKKIANSSQFWTMFNFF